MKNYEVKIIGSGTPQQIIESLQSVIAALNSEEIADRLYLEDFYLVTEIDELEDAN